MRSRGAVCVALMTLAVWGCIPPEPPGPVSVRLANSSGFIVDANLYVSRSAVGASQLFVPSIFYDAWKGSRIFPVLEPGEVVDFTIECDDAGSIGVDQPLFTSVVTGLASRSTDAIALKRPADFDCEQRVTFTYTAKPSEDAYNVSSSVK
jgi:hypothetical protein